MPPLSLPEPVAVRAEAPRYEVAEYAGVLSRSLRNEAGARRFNLISSKLLASSANTIDSARHAQIAAMVAFTLLSIPSSPPTRRPSKNTSATA